MLLTVWYLFKPGFISLFKVPRMFLSDVLAASSLAGDIRPAQKMSKMRGRVQRNGSAGLPSAL